MSIEEDKVDVAAATDEIGEILLDEVHCVQKLKARVEVQLWVAKTL